MRSQLKLLSLSLFILIIFGQQQALAQHQVAHIGDVTISDCNSGLHNLAQLEFDITSVTGFSVSEFQAVNASLQPIHHFYSIRYSQYNSRAPPLA